MLYCVSAVCACMNVCACACVCVVLPDSSGYNIFSFMFKNLTQALTVARIWKDTGDQISNAQHSHVETIIMMPMK